MTTTIIRTISIKFYMTGYFKLGFLCAGIVLGTWSIVTSDYVWCKEYFSFDIVAMVT